MLEQIEKIRKQVEKNNENLERELERKEQVRKMKEKGMSFTQIGKELGVSRQRAHILYKGNPQKKTKWEDIAIEWKALYTVAKMPIHIIAEKYNCSTGAVHYQLKKMGVDTSK